MGDILHRLRSAVSPPNGAATSDGELLEGFVTGRDAAAFAALVRRHGPMVWGVCRRVLASHHDAEDAFQATFLVLVRKAASVSPRELVANWLYGVAHQTARNARATAARRRSRERPVTETPEPAAPEPGLWRDLRPVLDQELSGLPAKYRTAIVLCDLEGKTRKDVARQLGVPEGTLSGWLTRGRAMLAKRLARRGVAVSGGTLAATLARDAVAAGVPAPTVAATIKAADLTAAGVIPGSVAALAGGVVRTMLWTNVGKIAVAVLLVASTGIGATGLVYHARARKAAAQGPADEQAKAQKPGRTGAAARPGPLGFTVGKDTTFITGPLDHDGYVDYETALNERLCQGIAPENNASALLWTALGPNPKGAPVLPEFFRWQKVAVPPARGDYFTGMIRYAKEHLRLDPGPQTNELLGQQRRAAQGPWVAKDYPAIAGWLKANDRPLAVAVEAAGRPDYYFPVVSNKSGDEGWYGLVGALLPGMYEWRELAAGLAARAMLRAGEGRFDAAWQDLLACHRLGRLLGRHAEPTVYRTSLAIDQIAGEAELALLDRANPSAHRARAWLHDLQALPPTPPIADWYDLGGRFTFLDSVLHVRRSGVRFLQLLDAIDERPRTRPRAAGAETGPVPVETLDWDLLLRTCNAWYDRMAAAYRIQDRAAREKEFERIEQEIQALQNEAGALEDVIRDRRAGRQVSKRLGNWLVAFYLQGLRQVREAIDRAEQAQRNRYVAFALAAYRGEIGRYPEKLDALTPKYLAEMPNDLFSGGALVYRPSGDGYLLYSVGVNGRDDDGRGADDSPPGDDPCVRMPLPEPPRK
jgi:RNA polymerase sigma factor (sigma-70 family)